MNKRAKIWCIILATCIFAACSTPDEKIGKKAALFSCRDGKKFSLSFSESRRIATIVFENGKKEVLHDNDVASGIEYGGKKYVFKEYKGRITLDDNSHAIRCFENSPASPKSK